jgi:acyl carrier protein
LTKNVVYYRINVAKMLEDIKMFEKIKKILVEQLGVAEERVTMEANIVEDLEADSLSVMQTIMELEEEFGLTVEDEDVNSLRTVGEIVKYCESKVK